MKFSSQGRVTLITLLAFISFAASATPQKEESSGFNWLLLDGVWAESTDHLFGCSPENLHQHFEVSPDKKTITFANDRLWEIGSGQKVAKYSATILRFSPNVLVIRYGSELSGIPDQFREWEMRFIGPGTYRWRATAWPEGAYNEVIGVKCS